jgi:hypothetical protein
MVREWPVGRWAFVTREFMLAPLAALNGCDDERYDGIINILTY